MPRARPHLAARWSASRLGRFTERLLDGDAKAGRPVLGLLVLVVAALTWGSIALPNWDPPSSLVFPVLLGGVLLNRRRQLALLAGALCALLDAVPADGFLEAANDYVILRGWEENFATAVHASLDPSTGRFEVYNAGHHPAARWRQRERRWEPLELSGLPLDRAATVPAVARSLGSF